MPDDAALRRLRALAKQQVASTYRQQEHRWKSVLITIDAAKDQIVAMRQGAIEEGQRDNSVPLWLSVLITVGLGLVPLGPVTSTVLGATVNFTRGLFRRLKFSTSRTKVDVLVDRLVDSPGFAAKTGLHQVLGRYDAQQYQKNLELTPFNASQYETYQNAVREQLSENEDIAKTMLRVFSPGVENATVNLAQKLLEAGATPQFRLNAKSRAIERTDAPSVVISVVLKKWVNDMMLAEGLALDKINLYIDTADNLTESDVEKFVQELEGGVARIPAAESEVTMKDLQLLIECCIWCSTFDFRLLPVPARVIRTKLDGNFTVAPGFEPIPLNPALWKRLIERYPDPDLGVSFKEVGPNNRLGPIGDHFAFADQMGGPGDLGKQPFSPELRLSYYFSHVLAPRLSELHTQFARRTLAGKR